MLEWRDRNWRAEVGKGKQRKGISRPSEIGSPKLHGAGKKAQNDPQITPVPSPGATPVPFSEATGQAGQAGQAQITRINGRPG